jgi:P2-related tail formation protein
VHKQKGTISALRHALAPISAGIRVREWWQTTPPGPRGTFQLDFDVLDSGVISGMHQEIERLVDEAKPVTRHMTGLAINLGVRGAAQVGAAVQIGDELTIYARTPEEVRVTGRYGTNGMTHSIDTMTIHAWPTSGARAGMAGPGAQ